MKSGWLFGCPEAWLAPALMEWGAFVCVCVQTETNNSNLALKTTEHHLWAWTCYRGEADGFCSAFWKAKSLFFTCLMCFVKLSSLTMFMLLPETDSFFQVACFNQGYLPVFSLLQVVIVNGFLGSFARLWLFKNCLLSLTLKTFN